MSAPPAEALGRRSPNAAKVYNALTYVEAVEEGKSHYGIKPDRVVLGA